MRTARRGPVTNTQLLILGYGHSRYYSDQPAFSLPELAIASAENNYIINVCNLYRPAGQLAVAGYLSASRRYGPKKVDFSGTPALRYVFNKEGEQPLIDGVMYGVRQRGKNLHEMLRLSESVEALVERADFFGRLENELLNQTSELPGVAFRQSK